MIDTLGVAALINFAVWLAAMVWVFGYRRMPLYHPVALLCIYQFLGFVARPVLVYLSGYSVIWERTGVSPDNGTLLYTAAVASIGFISVLLGSELGSPKSGLIGRVQPLKLHVGAPGRFYAAAIILLALGVYGMMTSYGGAGLETVQAFEVSYDDAGGQRLVGVSGYVLALAEFVPVICIVLFLNRRSRKFAIALLCGYVAVRLYIGAQRLSFVVALIGVYLLLLINRGRRYPSVAIIVVALVFALAFDIIGGDRFAFRRVFYGEADFTSILESYQASRDRAALISDVAEFDVASAVLTIVPEKTGWTYGTQYLRLLIWPIPRQLWEDKPIFTSRIDLNEFGNFLSLTHTLYVDAYSVYGLLPMVVILLGLGYFLSRLYERARTTTSVMWFMLFWLQLIYMKTLLRDGGVTVFYFIGVSMVGVFLLKAAGRLRIERVPPGAGA